MHGATFAFDLSNFPPLPATILLFPSSSSHSPERGRDARRRFRFWRREKIFEFLIWVILRANWERRPIQNEDRLFPGPRGHRAAGPAARHGLGHSPWVATYTSRFFENKNNVFYFFFCFLIKTIAWNRGTQNNWFGNPAAEFFFPSRSSWLCRYWRVNCYIRPFFTIGACSDVITVLRACLAFLYFTLN